jgi:hypothetical protein
MNGHWIRDTSSAQIKSYLWKWADIYEGLEQACKLIPVDKAGRRTIQLRNPNLSGGTSHTIGLAVQAVLPGESRSSSSQYSVQTSLSSFPDATSQKKASIDARRFSYSKRTDMIAALVRDLFPRCDLDRSSLFTVKAEGIHDWSIVHDKENGFSIGVMPWWCHWRAIAKSSGTPAVFL